MNDFFLICLLGLIACIAIILYRLYKAIKYSNRILNRKSNSWVSFLFQQGVPIIKELLLQKHPSTASPLGYNYQRKSCFMTESEQDFFTILESVIGDRLYIFPQVNLTTILKETNKDKNRQAARNHINRKSVDFVLCDKKYIAPLLAIELDGNSHEREDREERDEEVERIFANAKFPLLRIPRQVNYDPNELIQKITQTLKQ